MTTPADAASPASSPPPANVPAAHGFAPDLAERLDYGLRSGLLRNVHVVHVMRRGQTVLERYYSGDDENWGRPLGRVAFGANTLHDLRSVTKSVVSLLYGIAHNLGKVPAPHLPLLAQFPEHADLAKDPARAAWTIQHVLDMALGTEWNEQLPYTDPNNSEILMEHAPDRIRFILDRPIVSPAGKHWNYSGGCTALIGHLIAKGTGLSLPAFARKELFDPLGITNFEWNEGRDGAPSAASGLRLTAADLARIGDLLCTKGARARDGSSRSGNQIVPAAWIETVLKPSLPTGDGLQFGRFWFHGDAPSMPQIPLWIAGFGNGGQRLWVCPSLEITCVSFSGAYNQPDNWITPARIWREIVLGNVMKR